MVALGCKYLRICHLNNCATGVATQNKILRMKHFSGSPERVVNYFKFVAEDVRNILSNLGFKSLDDIIGRTDLLKQIKGSTKKHRKLNLKKLLVNIKSKNPSSCTTKSKEIKTIEPKVRVY